MSYPASSLSSASLSVKNLSHPGASPPTASSAPLNTRSPHASYSVSPGPVNNQQVQTQPLDLGISSNKSRFVFLVVVDFSNYTANRLQ